LAGTASFVIPPSMRFGEGLFFDLETAVAARFARPDADSRFAVIALDEESLEDPKLAALPRALMAPLHGKVLDGLLASGADVVGYDLVFSWSGNALALGEQVVAPNYDRPFIDALRRGRERIVLAESARVGVALPYAAVMRAGIDRWALGHVEIFADPDGVVRHMPLLVETTNGTWVPTISGAILGRLGRMPGVEPLLLRPTRHLAAVPTYRFSDVLRCAETNPASLEAIVRGRTVLIGTTLVDEDRVVTAGRFLPPPPRPPAPPREACPPATIAFATPESSSVPGVYLHAAAVEAALAGTSAAAAQPIHRAVLSALAASLAAWLGFRLRPWVSLLASAGVGTGVLLVAALALAFGVWVPVVPTVSFALLAGIVAYGVRFLVEERKRLRAQRAFGHFLAPILVERIVENDEALRLGGELRNVSVLFADLSGFTALSGRVAPGVLMEITNRYLALIVSAVEATGGYVDKFIGDAVMALWGAPTSDPDHALHAAETALLAVERVEALRTEDASRGMVGFTVKIGVNSGAAVVGNVGADKRYNYTAVGETVNLAARLEGLPSDYGCAVVVGPRTAEEAAAMFLFCELDRVVVKGKDEPLAVYELVARRAAVGPRERRYVEGYARALASYRAGRFAEAEILWRALEHPTRRGGKPSPPEVMADRAARLRDEKPQGWDGVWVKTVK